MSPLLTILPSSSAANSHSSHAALLVKRAYATGATCVLTTRIISRASSTPGSKCSTALRPDSASASKERIEHTSLQQTSKQILETANHSHPAPYPSPPEQAPIPPPPGYP